MTDSLLFRRTGLAGGVGTLAGTPRAPFDTLRDYVAALDANGLLLRFPEVDQDKYEATGLVYRANDRYGFTGVFAAVDRLYGTALGKWGATALKWPPP